MPTGATATAWLVNKSAVTSRDDAQPLRMICGGNHTVLARHYRPRISPTSPRQLSFRWGCKFTLRNWKIGIRCHFRAIWACNFTRVALRMQIFPRNCKRILLASSCDHFGGPYLAYSLAFHRAWTFLNRCQQRGWHRAGRIFSHGGVELASEN